MPVGEVSRQLGAPSCDVRRPDMQRVLIELIGPERVKMGSEVVGVEQRDGTAEVLLADGGRSAGDLVIACDGVHSVVRRQFHPDEGEPVYSGVNIWRGTTVGPPFLSGATMVRAGWLDRGKLIAYPIRDDVDGTGNQLISWVAEFETPHHVVRDWNRRGDLDDFIGAFEDWHFDWLDVPALLRASDQILEFPMVDQDPVDRWTFGRVTLLGDAAHPMLPRGSNGAGQAILDARAMGALLGGTADVEAAFTAYEKQRLPATTKVVLTNRSTPPDVIIRAVRDRIGDRPFERIDDVISQEELAEISRRYKEVAGMSAERLLTGG
jgi:5-methylphenazine-1-carboxylate 1-monooxygenase